MADADSSMGTRAPVPDPFPFDSLAFPLDSSPEACFVLVQDSFLELLAICSAYSDLAELMDAGLPEFTFLAMLNDRFSSFVRELPPYQRH